LTDRFDTTVRAKPARGTHELALQRSDDETGFSSTRASLGEVIWARPKDSVEGIIVELHDG
jgi:hypothetical protein